MKELRSTVTKTARVSRYGELVMFSDKCALLPAGVSWVPDRTDCTLHHRGRDEVCGDCVVLRRRVAENPSWLNGRGRKPYETLNEETAVLIQQGYVTYS